MGVELIKVRPEDDGMRLNRWFLKYYPGLGLSRLQKLLRTKQIKVDGSRAEAGYKLSSGQEIRVPPLQAEAAVLQTGGVSDKDAAFVKSLVLYRDDDLIAINKPAGLAVQGGTNTLRHLDGMLDALKFDYAETPKLVHRIDKETSGVLILARRRLSAEKLTRAFREKNLRKTYLALTFGVPKPQKGNINVPLLKIGEKMRASTDGKAAQTLYRVIDSVGNKLALVEASPLTGRTHQIRAHLESIGCPIAGDDKYFGLKRQKASELENKLFLHAYKIDLSEIYKRQLIIKAPLPPHFRQALDLFGLNWEE